MRLTLLLFLFTGLRFGYSQDSKKVSAAKAHFELELNGEYRYFYNEAQFLGQKKHYPSIAVTPSYSLNWNKGYQNFTTTVFFIADRDAKRTYWDLREFYYQKAKNNWELNIGLKKVFWGVAESNHLVDIINQSDALKSFDGEQKLGQPMVQFSLYASKMGTFDFFYLPYHRSRRFAGTRGRFRFATPIEDGSITYESKQNEWHPDFSVRWKNYFGPVDIGLSYFKGNGREPYFEFDPLGNINAFYPYIDQIGLDVQITANALLLKFESIYRDAADQRFIAAVAGFEYTFSNIDGNGLDIGIIGEYLYDERDAFALSGLQNDLFYGIRLAFNDINDTAILLGGIVDLDTQTNLMTLEASRRVANNLIVTLEARLFDTISSQELFLSFFKQDSFLAFSFSKYF